MMKHFIRYLIRTKDFGIQIPNGHSNPQLVGWSDTDWARDFTGRHLRSGYVPLVANAPVVSSSRLQSKTAHSTSESEFNELSK